MTSRQNDSLSPIDTVLFDVDGTLIDSTYHHALAWTRAFARFDLFPPTWRVHRAVGMGGDKLVAAVAGDDAERRHGDDLRSAWEEEYRTLLPEVRAFDGAADAVRAVRAEGYKVALASSGKAEFTEVAMGRMGLKRDEVDAVTSSDDADESKPEPDILAAALRDAGGTRGVLVGDATWDAESAKRFQGAIDAMRRGAHRRVLRSGIEGRGSRRRSRIGERHARRFVARQS